MKNALLVGLLLAGCSSPKYSNPVVVKSDNTPIRESADKESKVIALADKGDTLELQRFSGDGFYNVSLDDHYTRFKGGRKTGYIATGLLQVPDSTLSKLKAGTLGLPPAQPQVAPEHINVKK